MATTSLEELQRVDHDALVRVEAKLDNLSADVKVMGDSINIKILDHETRIRKIEDIIIKAMPDENIGRLNQVIQDVRDMKKDANTYRLIAGSIGGAIMFLLTQMPNWIRLFFK